MASLGASIRRFVSLVLDPASALRMEKDAEAALQRAGKFGGEAFEKEMAAGGAKAVRALTTALKQEYESTIAAARLRAARSGDWGEFDKIRKEADATFNARLIPAMEKLQKEGKLTENQFAQLARQIKQTGDAGEKDMDRASKGMDRLRGAALAVKAAVVGWISTQAVAFTKMLVDVAGAAEDTRGYYEQVFTYARGQADKFIASFANAAGMTVTEMRAVMAQLGSSAQAMGMTQEQGVKFAERTVRLAADLRAATGGTMEDALGAIRSGLRGEFDPLERYVAGVTDAAVKTKALTMAGKSNADELTTQEKATAFLALAYENAGKAVGQFEREMGGLSQRTGEMGARYRELKERLAIDLLPTFEKYSEALLKWATENEAALDETIETVSVLMQTLMALAEFTAKTIVITVEVVGGALSILREIRDFTENPRAYTRDVRTTGRGNASASNLRPLTEDEARAHAEAMGFPYSGGAAAAADPPAGGSGGYTPAQEEERAAEAAALTARQRQADRERREKELREARERRAKQDATRLENERRKREREMAAVRAEQAAGRRAGLDDEPAVGAAVQLNTTTRGGAPIYPDRGKTALSRGDEMQRDRENLRGQTEWLQRVLNLRHLNAEEVERARSAEEQILKLLQDETLTAAVRVDLEEQLADVRMVLLEVPSLAGAMESGFNSAVASMGDAISQFVESASTDLGQLAEGAKGVGAAMVSGMLQGFAGYARARAALSFAEAGWPPNPLKLRQGLAFTLAAGLFDGLAARMNSAARGGGAGGAGGGGVSAPSLVGVDTAQRAGQLGAEVHIYIDPLDPRNPAVQDFVAGAQQRATERHGANARVSLHPYPSAA